MKWVLAVVALLLGWAGGYFLAPGDVSEGATAAGGGQAPNLIRDSEGGAVRGESLRPSGRSGVPTEASAERRAITVEWMETLEDLGAFDQIGALHARLRNMNTSEFPKLMDELGLLTGTALNWQVRSMIASRWAQLDPQGMLAYAREQKGRMSWSLYNSVFSAWTKQDPKAAYAAALQLDTQRSQRAAVLAIINTISADDPQRAIETAQDYFGGDVGGRGRWIFQSIYRNWAQRDGDAARASALTQEEGAAKSSALAGAMSEWMAEDPVGALAWLDSLPMDSAVYGSRKEVFRNFLNQDFEVAREYIDSVDDPLARREILENLQFHNFGWQKSYEEIEAIFDWIGTVATGQVYDNRVSGIISAMAENDPDRAVDFVLNMRPGNARMNGLGSVASKLVEIDPQRAFEFVDSLGFEDEKRRALGNMGWRLSQQGAESASALIAAHNDPVVQQQLASRISGEWANYDIEAARIWSEALPDEQARQSSLRAVMKKWIESDPAATLAYVENSLETGDRGSVLRDAYSHWVRNDPQTAVEWLDRLPEDLEGRDRSNIFRGVASSYIQHDPLAASEWIATLDESPERDESVETLVNNISKTDPEASFIWAATVGDADKRKNTLHRSVQAWTKTDPEAAYEAIVDAKIEAAEKEPLLKMLEGKR
jgi:hypothetical protein